MISCPLINLVVVSDLTKRRVSGNHRPYELDKDSLGNDQTCDNVVHDLEPLDHSGLAHLVVRWNDHRKIDDCFISRRELSNVVGVNPSGEFRRNGSWRDFDDHCRLLFVHAYS